MQKINSNNKKKKLIIEDNKEGGNSRILTSAMHNVFTIPYSLGFPGLASSQTQSKQKVREILHFSSSIFLLVYNVEMAAEK